MRFIGLALVVVLLPSCATTSFSVLDGPIIGTPGYETAVAPGSENYEFVLSAETRYRPFFGHEQFLVYCKEVPGPQVDGYTCYKIIDDEEVESLGKRWPGDEDNDVKTFTRRLNGAVEAPIAIDEIAAKTAVSLYEVLGWRPYLPEDQWKRDLAFVKSNIEGGVSANTLVEAARKGYSKVASDATLQQIVLAGMQ